MAFRKEPVRLPGTEQPVLCILMKRFIKAVVRLLALIAAGVIIHLYVISLLPMHGNYMYPAIRDGDLCVVYRLGKIRQNEPVVYTYNGEQRIGRVIAVEGSKVTMSEEGSLMIDGYVPAEEVFYPTMPGKLGNTIEIKKDEWLILNDLRTEQGDSRDMGCIKTSDIKGTILFIFRRRGI